MDVVHGIEALESSHGRLFVVVGVFDGLHLGHRYLLEQLVAESARQGARPTVITFDHHPDEVLTGAAPPLLMDPAERLERLAGSGVEVTVVQHFDAALRTTTYDAFVARVRARVDLAGFLMTPDAAFGFERRGTPEALAALGAERGFAVVVVPPFRLGDGAVSSTAIRSAIAAGDLARARALVGRDIVLRATVTGTDPDGAATLGFPLPVALPPEGAYPCTVDGEEALLRIVGHAVTLEPVPRTAQVVIELSSGTTAKGSPSESAGPASGVHDGTKPATIRRS